MDGLFWRDVASHAAHWDDCVVKLGKEAGGIGVGSEYHFGRFYNTSSRVDEVGSVVGGCDGRNCCQSLEV